MIKLLPRLSALVLVVLLAPGLSVAPAAAEEPAPDRSTARFEVNFLTGMINHHAMAVEMADLCLDKAVHPELEAMCESIKTSQSQQIDMMQSWLQDWYDIIHEPEMKPGDMRRMDRLASLDGEEFEIEFMESMIRHHRKAIREGEQCLRRAYHPGLLDLCENIIQTQSAEIVRLEQWLCEWYERCKGRNAA